MSEHRADKRFRRRSACELHADGRKQRAIVLDLSRTGLFVQTSARLAPGTSVELLVHFEGQGEPMLLRARVARQNQVPSNLTNVARGGIGLYLLEAPKAYLEIVDLQNETRARNGPAPTPAAKPADAPVFPHFRVRVKQIEGNRSRVLNVTAASAARACADALTQLGAGWEALGGRADLRAAWDFEGQGVNLPPARLELPRPGAVKAPSRATGSRGCAASVPHLYRF